MMKRYFEFSAILLLIFFCSRTYAGDLEIVLAPPQESAQAGKEVVFTLYFHNYTDAAITTEIAQKISCRIFTDHSSVMIDAFLLASEPEAKLKIRGKGFAKKQYGIKLPVYTSGTVRIEPVGIDTNPLTIQVSKAPSEEWGGQQVPLDDAATLVQSFLKDLSVYNPMYFLFGVDPGLEQSKFQFSFKYRLFNTEGFLAEKAPWVSGFHLGYTQRSIWDLKSESKPFDDTSYMPEVFYLLPKIDLGIDRISAFGIQGGFQHESNGKGGEDSRSTNYLYIRPVMGIHLFGPYHVKIAPKIYTYVENEDETNEDLDDYRGYFDLEAGVLNPEGIALNSHLFWGKEGGSIQLDLTYPMSQLLGKSLNVYLQAQYFSGYAETLLHYNERHDAFRLGFAIVR
jgi:outer membrane phospholipase A